MQALVGFAAWCVLLSLALPVDGVAGSRDQAVLPTSAEAGPEGPGWSDLPATSRVALMPLQRDWNRLDRSSKEKWLALAERFPGMSATEQQRVQARMAEWARLPANQRSQARIRFQQARELTPDERRARWNEYQQLAPEQRRELSRDPQRNKDTGALDMSARGEASRLSASKPGRSRRAGEVNASKSNLVPLSANDRPAATAVDNAAVRRGAGATTTLINQRPAPPPHLQPGLPKIAATAPFVDPDTLLPRRGPQAAAVRGQPGASATQRLP